MANCRCGVNAIGKHRVKKNVPFGRNILLSYYIYYNILIKFSSHYFWSLAEKTAFGMNIAVDLTGCRSTSARLVDNCSLSWRIYQSRRQQTKNSRLKKFFLILNASVLYLGYLLDTYSPCIHTCKFCKQYVVVTYRSKICSPCKSTYPIRVILVNSSWLGRNRYGANG